MAGDPERPKRKPHRLSADVYASSRYVFSFTICARHQGRPFQDPELAEAVIESLLWTRRKYSWRLFCYCLMPDHLHLVCRLFDARNAAEGVPYKMQNSGSRGEQPEGVLDHVARFKSFTTRRSWEFGVRGKLWQTSSYDRCLDSERSFEEVVRYTLENPQRAGLVADWRDWPYAKTVDPL